MNEFVVSKYANTRIATRFICGINTGNADDVGTDNETWILSDVIIFNDLGDVIRSDDGWGVLASHNLTTDDDEFWYFRQHYFDKMITDAEDAMREASEALHDATVRFNKFNNAALADMTERN